MPYIVLKIEHEFFCVLRFIIVKKEDNSSS